VQSRRDEAIRSGRLCVRVAGLRSEPLIAMIERMRAESLALRDFTAKVEREWAERAA
jgi:hypothetical protein